MNEIKVNLLYGSDDVREGYINIDPLAQENSNKIRISPLHLSSIVDDGEAADFLALDTINYLPASEVDNAIKLWCKTLRHGGTITIGGVEARIVSKAMLNCSLDFGDFSKIMYGEQKNNADYKRSCYNINMIENILANTGFKILKKSINNYTYFVTGERL